MDDSIKRWTAKRKTALVIEIILGKTTVAVASLSSDFSPSEIEVWVGDARRGMENSLRAIRVANAGELAAPREEGPRAIAALHQDLAAQQDKIERRIEVARAERSSRICNPSLRLEPPGDQTRDRTADH
ncbi:hypothetical protein [Pseudogemmobacter bohemicus]|uniref:hypothetical protein n=1 Tax=Pseudogemmobacter bohemicus TaxID=2250708 RepID=UPI001E426DCC|nr:hypothetical protein [Pseudogemmobacter bohemicus]